METLDLHDIQGIVARGFGNLHAACYVLLEIVEPRAAGAWLGGLVGRLTTSQTRPEGTALNLAFTPSGLEKLGLPPDALGKFSDEFVHGMTTPHRRRILGDMEENAPERWRWGGPGGALDALLLLFAADEAGLDAAYGALAAEFSSGGVREVMRLDTADLDGVEPFGFRDGISQPLVEGLGRSGPAANTIKAGEFVLGYRNEYDLYTARPTLDRSQDPGRILPADPEGSGRADLGRNGTYLVFRQLQQDVRGFWRFVDRATRRADGTSNPDARLKLAARMVGRWPSGAPLVLAAERDDPSLADANDFAYHHADEHGLRCPVGAHVRRAHPRDSLDPEPGTEKSWTINKRHRLLRRGREYGPPLTTEDLWQTEGPIHAASGGEPSSTTSQTDYGRHAAQTAHAARTAEAAQAAPAEPGAPEPERGLHFICLNANIARQFEFVSFTWLNNPKFAGLYDDADPLVAPRHGAGATFTMPAYPVRSRVTGLPQFVTVRGGGYFFLPGIRAARYLASLPPRV
jgi:Dyp-type peroxidase family